MLRIRASMLPSWNDCARRTASKSFTPLIESAGYELRKLMPSVGAAVGTSVHAAVEHVLRGKIEDGQPGAFKDGVSVALGKFREEIAPGAEWDDTTGNLQTAEYQIERMALAYAPLVETIQPQAVELSLAAAIAPGWELTGHIDLYTADRRVDDLKTGAVRRPYQAQLGAYSLLAKSNGMPVDSIGITFVPRGKKTKPQPPPERMDYDVAVAERAAYTTIEAIRRDVEQFEKTGDPYSFAANNMSLMCSRKYCGAWGTAFCRLHMPAPAIHHDVD